MQEILGHSSVKTTMDTYSHVIPGMQEEAAERVQRLLFGSIPVMLLSEEENPEKNGRDGQEKVSCLQGKEGRAWQNSNLQSSDS
jgi:hypothetical protein